MDRWYNIPKETKVNAYTINPIPPNEIIKRWKSDYRTMQEEMIYGDSPTFDTMIEVIKIHVAKLNSVTWTMKKKFQTPVKNSK